MKRVLIVVLALLLAAGGYATYRYVQANPGLSQQVLSRLPGSIGAGKRQAGPLQASGLIEAEQVAVSSDTGGRIAALDVAKGDQVTAGQVLLTLDSSLLEAQMAQADAAVAAAQAQLDQLLAGARHEEIGRARAVLDQAQVGVQVAEQGVEDAQRLRDNPQELDLQIIQARIKADKAQDDAQAARLQAEAADLKYDLWGRTTRQLADGFDVRLPTGGTLHVDAPAERDQANVQWNVAGQEAWDAWQTAYAAEDAAQAAATALDDLRRQRANPISQDAQVNQAEASRRQAAAQVAQAQAALDALQEGATPQQIDVARRAVDQARAARAALDVQRDKLQVLAPRAGLVSQVAVHAGEVALPGASLVELADLGQTTLTVYIALPDLGRVGVDQPVEVSVDSFPDRVFHGSVTRISDQPEYTPRSIQIESQRASTVFAVEISLANPDRVLKPGMPADAVFVEGGS